MIQIGSDPIIDTGRHRIVKISRAKRLLATCRADCHRPGSQGRGVAICRYLRSMRRPSKRTEPAENMPSR
jgi:hypothetical protein